MFAQGPLGALLGKGCSPGSLPFVVSGDRRPQWSVSALFLGEVVAVRGLREQQVTCPECRRGDSPARTSAQTSESSTQARGPSSSGYCSLRSRLEGRAFGERQAETAAGGGCCCCGWTL